MSKIFKNSKMVFRMQNQDVVITGRVIYEFN